VASWQHTSDNPGISDEIEEILGNFGNDHYFPVVVAIILFTLTWKDPQFDEEMDFHDFFGMDQ